MSHTNFVVSNLSAYVEENKDVLLKNIMFGKGSRSRMSIQTGVKNKANLHPLDIAAVFADGSDCGFSSSSTATLTERTIEVANLAVNLEICPKNLVGKFAEYAVKANAQENPLPFEAEIMDGLVADINKKIDVMIWLGDKTNQSSDPVKKWIDGFITIATASVSGSTGVIGESISSGATCYEGIKQVYASIPEEVLGLGAEIYVSPAIFRGFMQDMVALNYYHYNPENANFDEFLLPGTDVKVVKVNGLAGSLKILATHPANLYYGTDGENDEEVIDAWWSQDDRTWKLDIEWNSGAQIAFLDRCVLGTFAATPVATTGIAGGVAKAATELAGLNASTKVYKTKEQS